MRIAVTAPTGNVGRPLVERLLEAGAGPDLVLLARHPEKLAHAAARGAAIRAGSLQDAAFVAEATRGADVLFWLTPPNYAAPDLRAYYGALGRSAAAVIEANRIPRVVHLSSIGAQLERGTGPIVGLHDVEAMLDAACPNVTHLRPAAFFQNFLWQIPSIKGMGAIFMPVAGSARGPMVDTRDIAAVAAGRLLDGAWTGRSTRGLHGPADVSYDEAAAIFSAAAGRRIAHVQITPEQAREALQGMGMSPGAAGAMLDLYRGVNDGTIVSEEPRSPETSSPTTLADFAREILAPALG